MRVMVLGASGYLGKKIIQCLQVAGYEVTGVYRMLSSEPETINKIRADVDAIKEEFQRKQYDWLINCAAVYERQGVTPHEVVDANMIFALRALNCALESGVKKILTIDTSLPKEFNLYSFSKKHFAEFGEFYVQKYGITFINVVLEMFYGEDEPENRFLISCCKKLLNGEDLLLTKGEQKRDIIHIEDVCRAIKLILETSLEGFCNVPVGSGESVSIRTIIEYMHKFMKSKSSLKFGAISARNNEPNCVADISLLNDMGFVLKYSWQQGLEHLCQESKIRFTKER